MYTQCKLMWTGDHFKIRLDNDGNSISLNGACSLNTPSPTTMALNYRRVVASSTVRCGSRRFIGAHLELLESRTECTRVAKLRYNQICCRNRVRPGNTSIIVDIL